MSISLTDEETEQIRLRIASLQQEHRDLDDVIHTLAGQPPADQLLLARLKKRKLALKDKVVRLEMLLVPDIPA